MRFGRKRLDVVVGTTGNGEAYDCPDCTDKYVQIVGTFTATLLIQGTIDGTNWHTIASVAATGMTAVPQTLVAIRIRTDAYTSQTGLQAWLGFREARSDS